MTKIFAATIILLSITSSALTEGSTRHSKSYFINASSLRCRKTPDVSAKVITTLKYGDFVLSGKKTENKIQTGKTKNYWYQVKSRKCWVYGNYVYPVKHTFKKSQVKIKKPTKSILVNYKGKTYKIAKSKKINKNFSMAALHRTKLDKNDYGERLAVLNNSNMRALAVTSPTMDGMLDGIKLFKSKNQTIVLANITCESSWGLIGFLIKNNKAINLGDIDVSKPSDGFDSESILNDVKIFLTKDGFIIIFNSAVYTHTRGDNSKIFPKSTLSYIYKNGKLSRHVRKK